MNRPNSVLLTEFKRDLISHAVSEKTLNRDTGEWEGGGPIDTPFQGCILPLTYRDISRLQLLDGGQYSLTDKKLYVEMEDNFLNQTKIEDPKNKIMYEIYEVRGDYDIINPLFKVYYMKKTEEVVGKQVIT